LRVGEVEHGLLLGQRAALDLERQVLLGAPRRLHRGREVLLDLQALLLGADQGPFGVLDLPARGRGGPLGVLLRARAAVIACCSCWFADVIWRAADVCDFAFAVALLAGLVVSVGERLQRVADALQSDGERGDRPERAATSAGRPAIAVPATPMPPPIANPAAAPRWTAAPASPSPRRCRGRRCR
jgi:hypothetical protein